MNLWLPNPPKRPKTYKMIWSYYMFMYYNKKCWANEKVQEYFLLQMSDVILHFIVFTLLKIDIEYHVKSNVGCVVITDMKLCN